VQALGYGVAIVTYDDAAKIKRFADDRAISYPILSDPKSEIIRAFGLLNEAYPPGSFAHGVPHPIIFVVDAQGVVRHRFSEAAYQQRPEIDLVLEAIRKGR
jgi:peroxiredoxin Q/BCP